MFNVHCPDWPLMFVVVNIARRTADTYHSYRCVNDYSRIFFNEHRTPHTHQLYSPRTAHIRHDSLRQWHPRFPLFSHDIWHIDTKRIRSACEMRRWEWQLAINGLRRQLLRTILCVKTFREAGKLGRNIGIKQCKV